jgi:LDH2 family malate/lactate/ureidoglycolate dehydrogenase
LASSKNTYLNNTVALALSFLKNSRYYGETTMKVRLDELKRTTLKVLSESGYPPEEAAVILDVLMYAQLRGNNQGIVKLIGAGMPRHPEARSIQVVKETKLSALLDGGKNAGMVAMNRALELALEKAREHGAGIVGTRNTRTSTGAIGYYANQIARAGYIGLAFSGSGEYVAMHGSYEPIFGTNPLAIGVPVAGRQSRDESALDAQHSTIVLDMATAAIAWFGLVEARTAGQSIPGDVAYDAQGQLTTDPAAALSGAIRAFGGHKGAGLAFMIEALTHGLVGTTPGADGKKDDWGNLIVVIDPELLGDREAFAQRVSELAVRVKATKRLPGADEILVPGERGNRILESALRENAIEVEDKLWQALKEKAG